MRRPRQQLIVSTRGWNDLVRWWFRNRIERVTVLPTPQWRHPWYTTCRWDLSEEVWTAEIHPGFCVSETGEGEPSMRTRASLVSRETLDRLEIEPADADADLRVDAWLSESPRLALNADVFRPVGTDADTGGNSLEAVPQEFLDRGVMGPQVLVTEAGEATLRIDGPVADRASARLLRACDLVLHHDRLALSPAVSIEGDTAVVDLTLAPPPGREASPYVVPTRKYDAPPAIDAASVLTGGATDPGTDTVPIATVWLLSPRGAKPGSDPDESWSAHVEHHLFWNVAYVTRQSADYVNPTRIELPLPDLGLGTLGGVGQRFAEAINKNLAELEAASAQVLNEGRFLTM